MPAGIATRSVRLRSVRPSPWQVSHGDSTIRPSPWHRGQAETLTICPSIVWRTERISPLPVALRALRRRSCPAFAPVPSHVSQRPRTGNSISFSVPRTASSNVIRMS